MIGRLIYQFKRGRQEKKWLNNFGAPTHSIHMGGGLGDHLLCTAVARELKKRNAGHLWMMSFHPEIFMHNPDVDAVVPEHPDYREFAKQQGAQHYEITYAERFPEKDVTIPPARHVIGELCFRAGIRGNVDIRPYFHLSPGEISGGGISKKQVVIQSVGNAGSAKMENKKWPHQRFQKVVDFLKKKYDCIQVGLEDESRLEGVHDLRGKTGLRHLASILSSSLFFIGTEGFIAHLARAVDCPGVLILGGRNRPDQIAYSCNETLYTPMPCSPCWQDNRCDFNRRCMEKIEVQHVLDAVTRLEKRLDKPLETETAILP